LRSWIGRCFKMAAPLTPARSFSGAFRNERDGWLESELDKACRKVCDTPLVSLWHGMKSWDSFEVGNPLSRPYELRAD
jgi:hypothetical protein